MREPVLCFALAATRPLLPETGTAVELTPKRPGRLEPGPLKSYIVGGYSANIPNRFLGFFGAQSKPHGVGLYVDFKLSVPFRDYGYDFYEDISVNRAENIYGDRLIDTDDEWVTVDLSMTKRVVPDVTVYWGAGVRSLRRIPAIYG